MLVLPVSKFLLTSIYVLCRHILLYKCNICMSRHLFITLVDQLQQLLGSRFYSTWYYTQAGVRRYISQEEQVGSEFACFVKLSIVFFECYFKPFLCFFTFSGVLTHEPSKGLCQEPIGGLTARPPAAFCASLFYAHII